MLAELCEKALAFTACCEVVAPPGSGSKVSGWLKSVVGVTTAAIRALSSGLRCSTTGPADIAAGPIAMSAKARAAAFVACMLEVLPAAPRRMQVCLNATKETTPPEEHLVPAAAPQRPWARTAQ